MPPANTGQFYRLSDGTWGIRYRLPDGSRRKRSGFRNRTEARRWHADSVLPLVNGHRRPTAATDLTLQELVDRYVDRYSKIREARTIATLRERLARPLDAYGAVRLSELDAMADDLAAWRTTLPPRYAHKIMGALRQVLAAGVRWRLIETNPAADAGENPEPPPAAIRPYTRVELDAIAAELDLRYEPIPDLGASTGLRPEEWSGLERPHVDRARGVLKVMQANVGGRIVPKLKTDGSRREVPLTRVALAALDRVPARLDRKLLFSAPAGGPLNLGNFRKRDWNPAVEAAGVERPATPYDLRDTFASNALHAGVTVFELARVMGTSVRMIERHYGALIDGAHAGIVARLDALEAAAARSDETEEAQQ